MQQIFHWKRIWVGLVISIGVRRNRLPLQLFHSNRRFLRIFGYRLPKANFLANQKISGSTSWHPAATLSWTNFKRNFDERGFSIVSASTGNERCLHAVRRFRGWNEARLSETKIKRRPSSSAQRRKRFVDDFVGVDKRRTRIYDEFAKRVESVRFSSLERDRADIGRVKWATPLRSNDAHLHTQPRSANQSFIRRPCVERAQIPRFATDFNATYIRTKPRA